MAVTLGDAVVMLRGDDSPLKGSLDSAEKHTQSVVRRIGGAIGTVVKAGFVAAGAGAAALVAGLASCIGPASDLAETTSKIGVVFDDQAARVMDFGKTASSALGMTTNEALAAAGVYGNLFRAMGIGTDASADMSLGLVQLASDLASFNNMEPTVVLDKLRAGLSGETEPLRTLGVNLNQATIEAKAFEMGLWDGEGALTAGAKAQASYALIMEQTKLAQGDFARTSEGLANRQRILNATLGDLRATIGTAVLPVVTQLAGAFLNMLKSEQFQAFVAYVTGVFLPQLIAMFGELVGWVQANWPTIQAVVGAVFDAIGAVIGIVVNDVIPALVAAFQTVYGWVQANWPMIQAIIDTVMQAVGAAIAWVSDEVLPLLTEAFSVVAGQIPAILDIIKTTVENVMGAVATFWAANGTAILSAASTAWDTIQALVGTAVRLIQTVVQTVMAAVHGDWSGVWEGIKTVTSTVWEGIKTLISGALTVLQTIIPVAWEAVKTVTGTIWDAIKGVLSAAWTDIQAKISTDLDSIKATISTKWTEAKTAIGEKWEEIKTLVSTKLDDVKNAITSFSLVEAGQALIEGMIQGIRNMASALVNAASGVINDAIQAARNLLGWHSPSTVFMEAGRSIGDGLILGMEQKKQAVYQAARDLAELAWAASQYKVAEMQEKKLIESLNKQRAFRDKVVKEEDEAKRKPSIPDATTWVFDPWKDLWGGPDDVFKAAPDPFKTVTQQTTKPTTTGGRGGGGGGSGSGGKIIVDDFGDAARAVLATLAVAPVTATTDDLMRQMEFEARLRGGAR